MRFAFVALLLAACELQPAPKQQPAPVIEVTPTPAPPPADASVVADTPAADAGPTPIAASQACITLAAHLVDVVVASATDQGQKTQYENERMTMTRSLAQACQQQWSMEAQKCYLATKTIAQIKACEKKFPPKPPAPANAGSGSAAGSAAQPGPNGMRPEPTGQH